MDDTSPPPPIIPTIRLDDPDPAPALRKACIDVGFFYLEGHGLELNDISTVFDETRKLFELPLDEKQSLSDHVLSRGYTAMSEETLDPTVQTEGDTKEGYYIGRDIPVDDARYDPTKLRGPNQWPTKEQLPEFQTVMENYHETVSNIAFQVVQLLAVALGLDKHYFDEHFQEPIATLRLLHYSEKESNPEEGIFGCGAHSDYGIITLLLTDENEGLQILHNDNKWIDVPPRPDAFIVNLGDMCERWTNGLMKSTKHRVVIKKQKSNGDTGNKRRERYSIPFFYDPTFDTVVECLDICMDKDNPPKYPPTTAGQHLVDKYHQTHADFSPEDAAKGSS